ncbi:MAG: MoaD/ThiS family protein [Deltaproteobacteria bacterium]|jgi:sulfur carrier protein ThiS|nr:MoaD/ThiS family protein [Deltaproteobacteria bacterium]
MQIEVRLLTGLKRYLPAPEATGTVRPLEIAEPATVKDVLKKLGIPLHMPKVIMINDRQGALDSEVALGDRITVFPPVGGG